MKKFEYNEPEFKVVLTAAVDILTASDGSGSGGSSGDPYDPSNPGGFVTPIIGG